ncbi:MAG TPA: NCS2 family permease [Candidatus Limihabitans stercoravium]|nr:NCS2 family permease [Candidatus Limihabitans stercoravium]
MAENTTTKRSWLDRTFKLSENGTTVRTEVIAGLTTFMAMVYILMVNAGMFSDPFGDGTNVLGVSYGAIYIATALSAIIGTVLIGLLAKLPLAQASGMGLNAFFVFTCVVTMGFTYANALVFVLIDGVVFVLLTVTGLRKKIFDAIPRAVRVAIPAGIGLFIAFIGAQNAKLVVADSSTGVAMGSMNLLNKSWGEVMPLIVTIIGLIAIAIMSQKKIKGAIFYGIIGSTILYYLLGLTTDMYDTLTVSIGNPLSAFGEWADQALVKVFTEGFDFSAYLAKEGNNVGSLVLLLVTSSLAFCIVDMFDTLGTLYGACARGNMLTAEGEVPNMNRAMLADAIATCTGAVCGTSTVTTFVESSAGIAEGGRTGLTSMVVALGFVVAMFLAPIAQLIPNCATATALIYVGVLMMNGVKELDWTDPAVAVPSFLTIAMMVFTYNISFGIGFGILSYIFINLFTGKAKEITPASYVLGLLFIAMFLFTH